MTVYPRVCGGTRRNARHRHMLTSGSIPACAGEPVQPGMWSRREYIEPGLSPRVRGNRSSIPLLRVRRSIPACAGEPSLGMVSGSAKPDTLRSIPACAGEPYGMRHGASRPFRGLSPRVRGNPGESLPSLRIKTGLSPRVRGNPDSCISIFVTTVYPRVCGGTVWSGCKQHQRVGLSPRVRGNRRRACQDNRAIVNRPKSRVYPRVCGGTF